VKAYMTDPRADKAVVASLRKAWETRGKLRAAMDERSRFAVEQENLERESEQLRRNLKSIEKIKDDPRDTAARQTTDKMRADFTERLAKASTRLGEITKRLTILDIEITEQSVQFRDLLAGIKLDKALPSP
jgi:predicted  nucleic acid-binding Zn-ribbon protein